MPEPSGNFYETILDNLPEYAAALTTALKNSCPRCATKPKLCSYCRAYGDGAGDLIDMVTAVIVQAVLKMRAERKDQQDAGTTAR